MKTSMTSFTSSTALEALSDELEKLSGERREAVKKSIKNALLIGAGTAAGTGATMLADKYVAPHLLPAIKKLPPTARAVLLTGAAGLSAAGSRHILKKMDEERAK